MNAPCSSITRKGGRCQKPAEGPQGLWCWNHDPANAAERQVRASRAARSKGLEASQLKREVKDLVDSIGSGAVDRADAAVMLQGYRVILEYINMERGVRVEDELAVEIEELKREKYERGHAS